VNDSALMLYINSHFPSSSGTMAPVPADGSNLSNREITDSMSSTDALLPEDMRRSSSRRSGEPEFISSSEMNGGGKDAAFASFGVKTLEAVDVAIAVVAAVIHARRDIVCDCGVETSLGFGFDNP